jgi:pimeloyl-ACP methyl ester carboxylesterase
VLRLDLRRHGRSEHIAGTLTLNDFVRDAVDVLDASTVPTAHVVGFSLGSMIAQGIALQHTDRVNRLVLLSVVAGRTAEERKRVQARLTILREQGIGAITGTVQERRFTSDFIARHPDVVAHRIRQLQENHAPSYAAPTPCSLPAIWATGCTLSARRRWPPPASTMLAPTRVWRATCPSRSKARA